MTTSLVGGWLRGWLSGWLRAWLSGGLAVVLIASIGFADVAHAAVTAVDSAGTRVTLATPARRVIALAPHLTEMMFAIGAGQQLVAVSDYSDFPLAARRLPRVGDAFSANREALLALQPDLVLVWRSSGGDSAAQSLRRLGMAVFVSEPERIQDVAAEMRALGALTGTPRSASAAATSYETTLGRASRAPQIDAPLSSMQRSAAPRVFMQVGAPVLYTVTNRQFLGQALSYCGAVNVFGELAGKAPIVSLEAVIAARPDIILQLDDVSARGTTSDNDVTSWRHLGLPVPLRVPGALLSRPGPRFAAGVLALCQALRQSRAR